ncbi:hypothetical protein B4102_0228 [Heyndrickxia sporothermodurans]|uniref:Phage tail tape measure protein domain-containing protein n=1 Tax=Heyndrickxia sporothermodurans TaxID=46224 RepID=A0A150KS49_9BACI|nr:phage tail tape measure protein [Heyndrickxia sporothermodurans]KYD02634.1 hypothetical protein B4102_0228 [Heyndrickxia sporothermodurans]
MAKKAFEISFQIGGKMASSFSSTFSKASKGLGDLKNQSKQTQRALSQLDSDFRRGKIYQSQYAEETRRLTGDLQRLERAQRRINTLKSTFSTGLNRVKTGAKIAAVSTVAAATLVAGNSMNKAASFEQQMTKAGVKAEATTSELKKLNDQALKLGANSSLSASQVAIAMDELAQKGFNAKKIMGAMPGIINAAESSGEDLALTSDVVTSALNAFELKATAANHVADVMAMSANRTAAGVADLGYSFKYAAPVAKTLGISLEELASSTGIMVDKGLSGEQAGTSLRMALIRLSKPPKQARKALDELGISVTDKSKKFKSITQISEEWNKATKDLTQTQKVQKAAAVFGTEAATGMLNLFSAGPKKINEMTKALENSNGTAKKAAKAMKDNYAGSLEQLSGSIESAQIKFATPILPVFKDIFNSFSSDIDKNLGGIEKAGKRVASGLRDIFEPFIMDKPKLTKAMQMNPDMMEQYSKDLAKYNSFKSMDFGDKVVYMLDEATAKIEKWLSGSGGDSMNKIFTKLGEIAAKAWINAFTGALKSSASNLFQGNFAASLGMGAAAWMMGGGLLVRGAIGAGKWGYDTYKGAKSRKSSKAPKGSKPKPPTPPPPPRAVEKSVPSKSNTQKPSVSPKNSKVVPLPSAAKTVAENTNKPGFFKKFLEGTSKVFKPVSKVLSKAAVPLTLVSEAVGIFKSKDKTKATVQSGAGIAGGWGGAKAGAAIGTAIAPGLGSAIGGILGGLGGYIGGKWLGGKAVDQTRAAAQPAPEAQQQNVNASSSALSQSTANLQNAINRSAGNFDILTMYAGQASGWIVGAFTGMKSSASLVSSNLDILTMYTGQASGWIVGAFNGINSSASLVTSNLDILTTYTGQASGWTVGAFNGIKSSADLVKGNLDILTTYTGQASGWLASLNGIQSAGQRVINALNNLERRINNIQLPSVKSKRVSYDG